MVTIKSLAEATVGKRNHAAIESHNTVALACCLQSLQRLPSPYAEHVHGAGVAIFFPSHKAGCQILIYNEFLEAYIKVMTQFARDISPIGQKLHVAAKNKIMN